MSTQLVADKQIRWWVPGDWNGFFGLFTNVVLNVIVLTGLCLGVVKMPDDIVFGRILPALGIALPIGNLYYAYLAYRLAKAEGRSDVTAMPYGTPILASIHFVPSPIPSELLTGRAPASVYMSPPVMTRPKMSPVTFGTTLMQCMVPSVTNRTPLGLTASPSGSFSSETTLVADRPSPR